MKTELNLSEYKFNYASQFGEDGVIKKLFELMKIDYGFLIDVGAWNGIYLSNTLYHSENNNKFSRILIESNKDRCGHAEIFNCPDRDCIYDVINCKVEKDGDYSLNNILDRSFSPLLLTPNEINIALLSIDIDGNDVDVFESLDTTKYRPAIVVIEEGRWKDVNALTNLESIFNKKGYNLVFITGNFIFVDRKYGIKAKDGNIHYLIRVSGFPEYAEFFCNHEEPQIIEIEE